MLSRIVWITVICLCFAICGFAGGIIVGSQRAFTRLLPVSVGENVDWRSTKIRWDGWSRPENTHRWSDSTQASMTFRLEAKPDSPYVYVKLNVFMVNGEQPFTLSLNGSPLQSQLNAFTHAGEYTFTVASDRLNIGENTIRIDLPRAAKPEGADPRILGIAITSLQLSQTN